MSAVYLTGRGLVTPAGGLGATWAALRLGVPCIAFEEGLGPVGRLGAGDEARLEQLRADKRWRSADRAVLLGVLAARQAFQESGATAGQGAGLAVVMGSSRGATGTLEREHDRFLEKGSATPVTSPQTTSGVFASAVAQDVGADGMALFVSSACSTGLNAVGVGMALLRSGQATRVLAGGAEASLTPFTIAQLRATSVAVKKPSALFPCRPMHPDRSGLVPGEGAACVMLASEPPLAGVATARVIGFGAATEAATATGISEDGGALVKAARQALADARMGAGDIDLVVGHGAGTLKGDAAELAAYEQIFEGHVPPVALHKWLTGHMLGAAAASSLILATQHLTMGELPALPYWEAGMPVGSAVPMILPVRTVMVCALGFGGSASVVVLEGV